MARWRKKPVEVNAWLIANLVSDAQRNWSMLPEQVRRAYDRGDIIFIGRPSSSRPGPAIQIRTLEGMMDGDWDGFLIEGVKGELYPCKREIFLATYDQVLV